MTYLSLSWRDWILLTNSSVRDLRLWSEDWSDDGRSARSRTGCTDVAGCGDGVGEGKSVREVCREPRIHGPPAVAAAAMRKPLLSRALNRGLLGGDGGNRTRVREVDHTGRHRLLCSIESCRWITQAARRAISQPLSLTRESRRSTRQPG